MASVRRGRAAHADQALLSTWVSAADGSAFEAAAAERALRPAAYLRMLVREHLVARARGAGTPVDRLIDEARADVIRDLRAKLGGKSS